MSAKLNFLFLLTPLLALTFAPSVSVASEEDDGFVSIFDGTTLTGWNGKPEFWSVRDGAVTGETTAEKPTDGNTFLIFKDEVSDFELRVKVRIFGGNSGIQFRSVNKGNSVVHGYQTDVDSTDKYMGDLYDEGGRGVLAKGGDKVSIGMKGDKTIVAKLSDRRDIISAINPMDWNTYVVIAKGNRIIQKINGLNTVDLVDNEKGRARANGVLAFQLHAGPPMRVQFKDIRIKRLR